MTKGRRFKLDFKKFAETTTFADAVLVDQVARLLDELEQIEARLAADGPTLTGSTGQPIAHWALRASRDHAATIGRLLAQLFPSEAGAGSASAKASRAAKTRWDRLRQQQGAV